MSSRGYKIRNRVRKKGSSGRRKGALICALIAITAIGAGFVSRSKPFFRGRGPASGVTKGDIANILGTRFVSDSPVATSETLKVANREFDIQYSIDTRLQDTVEHMIKRGRVPYAAFVALDARTGQVLAMYSHGMRGQNMNLRASFPAASIFKIVTAAAAIENGKLSHDSLIPVRGSFHTLYKQNVLRGGGIDPETKPRWARLISFEDALAKSVNSVFGKIGIFGVGRDGLRKIASRFLFGKKIPFEMPLEVSQAEIPDDEFGVAESASGYTRHNTLNPIHGALIAAAVANDGIMMEPSVVSRLSAKDHSIDYAFEQRSLGTVIDKTTAEQLSLMMHRTIVTGTSRGAFRNSQRSLALSEVFIGGKTGTLNGWDPAGRYDWFVGFGEHQNTKIAVASLIVHGSRRGVKSSQVARAVLENYFKPPVTASHPFQKNSGRL